MIPFDFVLIMSGHIFMGGRDIPELKNLQKLS